MLRRLAMWLAVPAMLLAAGVTEARAQTFTAGDFQYEVTGSGEVAVSDYSGGGGHVSIPGSVSYGGKNYDVTSIGEEAFRGCTGLTSIDLPDGLTSIEDYAFTDCTGLTSIDLPDDLTSIGYGTFSYCTGLTSIDLPAGLTSIEGYAFCGCRGLTSIDLPAGLTSIEDAAFKGCYGLTSIDLPDGVTSIGRFAFDGCDGLTSIDLPDGLKSIGSDAFRGCTGLTSIDLPDGLTSIGNETFLGCTGLTSIDLPDGVTSIGRSAFEGCTGLTSIDLPDGLTSIEEEAFKGCTGLTSVDLPDSLTRIKRSAFEGCTGLTSIGLPDGPTSIEDAAFKGCYGLTSIDLPAGLTSIWNGAFPKSVSAIIYRGGDYDVAELFSNQLDCIVAFDSLGGDDIHDASKGGCEVFWFTDADLPSRYYDSSTKVYTFKKGGYPEGFEFVSLGISVSGTYTYTGESHSLYIDGNTSSSEMEFLNGIDIIDAGDYNIDEVAFSFRNDSRRIYIPEVKVGLDEPLHFVIEQAPLGVSVSPSHVSMTYGERRPDFEVVYDGFLGDDDESSISVIPSVECASAEYPVAGTYPVTVSGGEARNYYFEYADGELTVEKAPLSVTGDSYTVTYGDELPDFGYEIDGFVLGEDEGDLLALPSVRLFSNPNAGSYTLSITGGEADNYRFDYHPGTLTVLKAAQTIDWPQDFPSGLSQGDMVEITATATSGLGITYESTNDDVAEVIHIDGRPYLSCVNDGSANIIATQPGDRNHEAAPSVTRRVNVGHGSGLAPSASSPSIGCRPSPARDVLEVTGTDASMTAAVYSPSGAMVLSSRCADGMTRLDVSRLDAGTYILVVSGGDGATARLRFAKE